MYDLESVDVLRERLDASYSEAREALVATDGDVVSALAYIEERRGLEPAGLQGFIGDVIDEAKGVVEGKSVTSAIVSVKGQRVLSIALDLTGVAGVAVVVAGALLSHCRLDVATGERADIAPDVSEQPSRGD